MTIYEALEKISGYVTDSELPTGIWGNIKDATDYLGKKLSLTPIQCCMVALLMEHYTEEKSEEKLCYFLDWETGDVLCVKEEMQKLIERGVVYPLFPIYRGGRQLHFYKASDALVDAFRNDSELVAPWELGGKTYEFWAGVGLVFCRFAKTKIRTETIFYALRNLIDRNRNLKCCQRLMEQNLDDRDLSLLLLVTTEYIIKDNREVEDYNCRKVLRGDVVEKITAQFEDSSSELYKKNLIQIAWKEDCCFCLTEHARQLLFDDDSIFGVLDADSDLSAGIEDEDCLVSQPKQQNLRVATFWKKIGELLHQRSIYEIRYGEFEREIMRMVYNCQHLDCCKRLVEQDLNCIDFVFLVVLCSKYIDCEWNGMLLSKYSDLVTLQCVSLIVRQFQNKTSDLLRKNLVSMSDNFATVSLTNHAKRLFVDTK